MIGYPGIGRSRKHIRMLRSDEREKERGGEAPMEIDSPPPLWLKSPTSKIFRKFKFYEQTLFFSGPSSIFHSPLNNTPAVTVNESDSNNNNAANNNINTADNKNNQSEDNTDENSKLIKSPNTTPSNIRSSILMRPHTSPLGTCSSTGRSPLRSCHTNSDAVTHLRRLATATYHANSSPPNRSPTVVHFDFY